jgi:adenylate cyclase
MAELTHLPRWRLNPRDPISGFAATLIAMSYYLEGNYETAVDTGKNGVVEYPEFALTRWYLVAALGQLGRKDEAATALHELLTVAPDLPVMIRNRPPHFRPEDHDHILDGLRKAGWQG